MCTFFYDPKIKHSQIIYIESLKSAQCAKLYWLPNSSINLFLIIPSAVAATVSSSHVYRLYDANLYSRFKYLEM